MDFNQKKVVITGGFCALGFLSHLLGFQSSCQFLHDFPTLSAEGQEYQSDIAVPTCRRYENEQRQPWRRSQESNNHRAIRKLFLEGHKARKRENLCQANRHV